MNRPDKVFNKLSKTERELGGIPNTSEDVKQAHASALNLTLKNILVMTLRELLGKKEILELCIFKEL